MFKDYVEFREIIDQLDESSLAISAPSWYSRVFGHAEATPVQSTDAWKRLVKKFKTATDRAEKLEIMQALNHMLKFGP